MADVEEARHEYGIELHSWDLLSKAEAIVAAVAHKPFLGMETEEFLKKLESGGCSIDVKARFNAKAFTDAGMHVWRL